MYFSSWSSKDIAEVTIQALAALGTIGAVILALYGDKVRKILFAPKFRTSAGSNVPFVQVCKKAISEFLLEHTEYESLVEVRIKLENVGGSIATNTQALVEVIFEKRPNNTYFERLRIPPTALPWHDENKTYSIIPRIPAYVGFAEIRKVVAGSTPDATSHGAQPTEEHLLYVPVLDQTDESTHINLKRGTFLVPINFYCDLFSKPVTRYFEIFWNGTNLNNLGSSIFYFKELTASELPAEVKTQLKQAR